MSSYDAFYQIKSEENHPDYLENLDELLFDHPRNLNLDLSEKKDQPLDPTNFTQKRSKQLARISRPVNLIDVNRDGLNSFIHTKKGMPKQTMELLPNFKTFIVRKIKQLLIIKVLNRQQTLNCLNFMRNNPSFKSINSLLNPIDKCQQLRDSLLELFSSSEIVQELMLSGIRMEQKINLIKYLDRIRDQIENPSKRRRWKDEFI